MAQCTWKEKKKLGMTFIYRNKNVAVWAEGYRGDIFTVFKGECEGLVTKKKKEKFKNTVSHLTQTYFTRSNTDTRLPTGLYSELPSGVNRTFPCLYTVPHMLEN
jgi:hypothetical protein